jgi:DnaA family protein
MQQLPLEISSPAEPDFGSFVPGANGEALARVRSLADGTLAETIVYLWGEPGSGRSHLLRAAARANAGLVVADDVEQLGADGQQALFVAINAAREGNAAVLAAGAAAPVALPLREDLRSRLGWGLVYQLRPLGDAEKAQHLRAEGERRGLKLGDDVVGFLLTRFPRDLPSLRGALEVLDRYSLIKQRALTLPLVREALAAAQQSAELPRQRGGR